jgi:hypothetical protein
VATAIAAPMLFFHFVLAAMAVSLKFACHDAGLVNKRMAMADCFPSLAIVATPGALSRC